MKGSGANYKLGLFIYCRTSIHRTFGQGQWQFVHDRLVLCQESMQALKANLKTIKV